ncbi:MAG: hypothetical protein FWF92_02305 [Oscillospiraceae bacterium]|nr:hypothetical protein [Oscillospiraceae bacterium]
MDIAKKIIDDVSGLFCRDDRPRSSAKSDFMLILYLRSVEGDAPYKQNSQYLCIFHPQYFLCDCHSNK